MPRHRRAVLVFLLSSLTAAIALIEACSTFESVDSPDAGDAAIAPDSGDAATNDGGEAGGDGACSAIVVTSHPFVTRDGGTVTAMASDGTNVYWASGAAISRAPIASPTNVDGYVEIGPVQQLVLTKGYVVALVGSTVRTRATGALSVQSTSYDGGWSRIDGDSQSLSLVGAKGGDLLQLELPGGSPSFLDHGYLSVEATATSAGLAVVAGTILPAQSIVRTYPDAGLLPIDPAPTDLATDGTTVVFTTAFGAVGSLPFAGGPIRMIASGQATPLVNLVLSGTYVYFASADGIRRVSLEDGCEDVVTLVPRAPFAVAGSRIFAASGSSILEVDVSPH